MPRFAKVYGWKDGNRFCSSLMPRESGGAANVYASPTDLVSEASARGLTVEWENPEEIDKWQA